MEVNVQELRIEMVKHGFKSISDLADKSGIDRNTLGAVIHQKSKPSIRTMERLIDTFGWSGARAGEIFFAEKLTQ